MPYLPTAQEWLTQSALLLQARPSTIRITTKYSLPRTPKEPKTEPTSPPPAPSNTSTAKPPPTATLTLKTYDPASGVTLKYQTNKAAEVGRLVQIMGRLGKGMAGLEMELRDESVAEKAEVEDSAPAPAPVPAAATAGKAVAPVQGGGGAGGQGGKKGKKKGKK